MFFLINKLNEIQWYTIDWIMFGIITCSIMISILLFTMIIVLINPRQLFSIINDTKELKELDTKIAHDVKHTGIFTKFLFRITSKGAERYF